MKCQLCEREAVADLCEYHQEAKEEVESGFEKWRYAYGDIEWKEYLGRIARNDQTGQWAAEVASLMLGGQK